MVGTPDGDGPVFRRTRSAQEREARENLAQANRDAERVQALQAEAHGADGAEGEGGEWNPGVYQESTVEEEVERSRDTEALRTAILI